MGGVPLGGVPLKPASKPSLDTAYALVNRAGEHIEEIKGIHNEIVAAQAKATVIKSVDHGPIPHGQSAVIAEGEILEHVPIPDKFRILIGEIANGLRSALNYLIGRLSELDCGAKGRNTQFPIETSPNGFKGHTARPGRLTEPKAIVVDHQLARLGGDGGAGAEDRDRERGDGGEEQEEDEGASRNTAQ